MTTQKTDTFKIGDRVVDSYLGAGTVVVAFGKRTGGYLVRFDDDANTLLRMSQNPCLIFQETLMAEGEVT